MKPADPAVPVDSGDHAGPADSSASGDKDDSNASKAPVSWVSPGGPNDSGTFGNSAGPSDTGSREYIASSAADAGNSGNTIKFIKDESASDEQSQVLIAVPNNAETKTETLTNPVKDELSAADKAINHAGQVSRRKETLVLEMVVGLSELIILGVLSLMIASDLRIIRWYRKKLKS